MASEDEATLKLLEDMIRRVVREELGRARPLSGKVWGEGRPIYPKPRPPFQPSYPPGWR